ncbi:hypothetical protein GCM10007420_22160 [Glycocaulis albus]|uniref:Uncharacterized protein n=1 Tax=Glycocaulis albus TaxID=1382801 RepID=A0ABQ1XW79_9PROT|nr:hypothetical protein [Glycocaulis albus]GGH05249.1 hypothetical protein GCM10007420_22160 [Glycocaulis albus]
MRGEACCDFHTGSLCTGGGVVRLCNGALALLAAILLGCADTTAQSGSEAGACVDIERIYTPGVRPGQTGQVRVIRRRVPCTAMADDINAAPFSNETAALRHLARQSFPVELTLHADPAWDPEETVVGRFVVPSEYFDPANPPLMDAIADGELTTFNAQFFVAFMDGRYISQVAAHNQTVQSVHQVSLGGRSDGDSVVGEREYLSESPHYEFTGETAHGLDLYVFQSPYEVKDQIWVGTAPDGAAVRIVCGSQRMDRHGPPDGPREYGLCTLNFMADTNIRVDLSLPHFQIEQWPVHRSEALRLVESWRTE